MPVFEYTAKKNPKEILKGRIEADSTSGAVSRLNDMGLFPLSISETEDNLSFDKENIRISVRLLIFFTREISDLLNSGVSLIDALDLISGQISDKRFKFVAIQIKEKVREGNSFSDALNNFPSIFSLFYVNVVKSGEASGSLEEVLDRLSKFYSRNQEIQSKMIEALIYPVFLIFMGFAAVMVLTIYVIPKLIPLFEEIGTQLPLITRVIVNLSEFFIDFWKSIVLLILILGGVAYKLFQSPKIFQTIQNLLIKLPFIKQFVSNLYLSEIFQSMESLLENGIPTLQAIDISKNSLNFIPYKNALQEIAIRIANGDSFSESLQASKVFPEKIQIIIRVGEESGKLVHAIRKLANNYSDAFERDAKVLTKVAGPVFIIMIAVVIGIIVIAMLLPILSINISF